MSTDSGIGSLAEKLGDANQTGLDILTKYRESNLYSRAKYIPLRPLNAISDEGPYQFMIGGYSNPDVIMLKSMRLTVKRKGDISGHNNVTLDVMWTRA